MKFQTCSTDQTIRILYILVSAVVFLPPTLNVQTEKSRHLLQVREKMRMLETLKFSEEFGSESDQTKPAEDSIPDERKDRLIRWVRSGSVNWGERGGVGEGG